jgi:DNA-binding CsgD family transcriptional regulator
MTQFVATPPPVQTAPQPTTPGIRDLTNRELEVMKLAADGKSNDEIPDELHLSVRTVRTDIQRAMMKLGARDRASSSSWPTRTAWSLRSPAQPERVTIVERHHSRNLAATPPNTADAVPGTTSVARRRRSASLLR